MMAMKLTEDNVYRVEHKLIHDTDLWDDMDNDKRNLVLVAYIPGINDMAQSIVNCMKDLEGLLMREILFRGKRLDNGEWVYGYLFCIWERAYTLWGTTNGVPDMVEVDPSTVGQFTGLLDKHGKRIFEGDVVKYTFDMPDNPNATENGKKVIIGRVFFSDWRASFSVTAGRNCSSNLNNDLFKYVRNGNRVEIIGNIYDNQELLKGGEDV